MLTFRDFLPVTAWAFVCAVLGVPSVTGAAAAAWETPFLDVWAEDWRCGFILMFLPFGTDDTPCGKTCCSGGSGRALRFGLDRCK